MLQTKKSKNLRNKLWQLKIQIRKVLIKNTWNKYFCLDNGLKRD
jgi:hypothetical protein